MAAAVPASMNGPKGMLDFSVPRREASRARLHSPPKRNAAKVPAKTCGQPRNPRYMPRTPASFTSPNPIPGG